MEEEDRVMMERTGLIRGPTIFAGNGKRITSPLDERREFKSRIIAEVRRKPGQTEREIAQALFGRSGYQQKVNTACRQLVAADILARMPTHPITYRPGPRIGAAFV